MSYYCCYCNYNFSMSGDERECPNCGRLVHVNELSCFAFEKSEIEENCKKLTPKHVAESFEKAKAADYIMSDEYVEFNAVIRIMKTEIPESAVAVVISEEEDIYS